METNDIATLARIKTAQIVGIDKNNSNQVIFARNTTDAMKIAYRLSDVQEGEEVVVEKNTFIGTRNVFEMHRDFGNTKKKNIGTTYSSDAIKENYEGYDTTTRVHHKITTIQGEAALENVLKEIHAQTKILVISHVNRLNGKICDLAKIAKEVKKQYPNILIIVDGAQAVGQLAKVDFPLLEKAGVDFYAGSTFHKRLEADQGACLYVAKKHRGKYSLLEKLSPEEQVIFTGMLPESSFSNVDEEFTPKRYSMIVAALQSQENRGLLKGNDFSEKVKKMQ